MARTIPVTESSAAADPPPFARIGIVGLGAIGSSIGLAARAAWRSVLIVGVDRRHVLADVQRAHAVDVSADDMGMLAEVDLIVLAMPLEDTLVLLATLAEVTTGRAVVTDVAPAKRAVVEAARALPERLTFIGGHPLVETRTGGVRQASVDCFRGRPWMLTPDRDTPADLVARLEIFVTSLGATPRRLSVDEHDRLVAGSADSSSL